ncbi:hypothetical protein, partial [Rhodobacter calidifons]
GEAGRAFLRRGAEGWRVVALSGESLRLAASFRVLGLSPRQAAELEAALVRAEAGAEPASRAAWDSFRGTLLLAGD